MPVAPRTAWAAALALAAVLAGMATLRYFALHSSLADLGFAMNNLERIAAGETWRLFWGHARPLLLPYAWVYGLVPDTWAPALLVSLQALALALPLAGILQWWGWLPGAAYLLYFPLWYVGLFDFHLDHLAVPLLILFFRWAQRGRMYPAMAAAALLALVKEPFAAQTAAAGLYLMLTRRGVARGGLLALFGAAYFVLVSQWVIPFFSEEAGSGARSAAFAWLGGDPLAMLGTLATEPGTVAQHVLTSAKAGYVFGLLAGVALVSVLAPVPLLVALPVLAISLLSDHAGHYGLKHHYTAGLIAPLVVSFAAGWPVVERIARHRRAWALPGALAVLLVVHVAYAPSPIGRLFWSGKVWSYGASAYWVTDRDRMIVAALNDHIPDRPEISVAAQNTLNYARLAHRKYYYIFPYGVLREANIPAERKFLWRDWLDFVQTGRKDRAPILERRADFVVLDWKRPWYVADQGCLWLWGSCRDREAAARFSAAVERTRDAYDPVFEKDGFIILRARQGAGSGTAVKVEGTERK